MYFLCRFPSISEQFCIRLLFIDLKTDKITWVIDVELCYVGIGKRIATRRKQLGLKQNVFAERIGISNNYLSSIERGKEKPTLDILVNICNALQVTPDYLLMGNLYSNNIPQNIVDGLRLCSEADLLLISVLITHMVERQGKKWNNDNFA